MPNLDDDLIERLEDVEVAKLVRDDLGVHFSFASVNEYLKNIQKFLLEIANRSAGRITDNDIQNFVRRANAFIALETRIIKFDPSHDGISERNSILSEAENEWQRVREELRTIYSFVKLETLDLDEYKQKEQILLESLDESDQKVNKLIQELVALPTHTESKYNNLFSDTQQKVDKELTRMQSAISDNTSRYERELSLRHSETLIISDDFQKKLSSLSAEVEEKISEVQQQARKFSAKEALTTYARIFENEAIDVNKPAIKKWEIILVVLVATEITAALILFFIFLPKVMEISALWGEEKIGLGLIISVIFVKLFILSTIAILISYAVKNLNAQNHLYATNKFKANSLSSFQAFIEATTDDRVIDQIIRQVSIAVYAQNVSGYLSKDDGNSMSQKDILDLVSKSIGK